MVSEDERDGVRAAMVYGGETWVMRKECCSELRELGEDDVWG